MLPRYFGENSEVAENDQSEDRVSLIFAAKKLFTNKIWLCMAIANSFDAFVIQVAAGFAVRYLSLTFQISSSTASMVCGVILIFSAILGQMFSSMILRKQETNTDGQKLVCLSRVTLVGPLISTLFCFAYILRCENGDINGVDFDSQSQFLEHTSSYNLLMTAGATGDICIDDSSVCKTLPVEFQLKCELGNFDPVCGGNVTYYSSCFAGCTDGMNNCLCSNSNITSGYCKNSNQPTCESWKPIVWSICVTITLFGVFWNMIPYMQLCIRSVDFNLRSQAIAWYSVIARALGSIPGPIFFGAILDTACVVWEPEEVDSCNLPDKFKAGSCMLFNSRSTSNMWLGMFLITRVLNGLLLVLMHHFAKERLKNEVSEVQINSSNNHNENLSSGKINSGFVNTSQ